MFWQLAFGNNPENLPSAPMKRILGDTRLTGVDIGGAINLQPHWYMFVGNMDFVVFEPDTKACENLRKLYDSRGFGNSVKILSLALSEERGRKTLFVTNQPTGSSLKPINESSHYVRRDNSYFYPVREVSLETHTLRDALDESEVGSIDAIKLDVQGAELDIFKGLDQTRLDVLLAVEMEVGLRDHYVGAATFAEIHRHMESQGFELFDVRCNRDHTQWGGDDGANSAEKLDTRLTSPSIAAKLAEFDLVYFRDPVAITRKRNAPQLRKLIACYCAYRYYLEALTSVGIGREAGLFDESEALQITDGIRELHDLSRSGNIQFESYLEANCNELWSQYMWTRYPIT